MVRCPAGAWEQRRRMEPEAAPQSEIGTCYVFIIITLTQENPEKPIDTFQHIVKNLTRTCKKPGHQIDVPERFMMFQITAL